MFDQVSAKLSINFVVSSDMQISGVFTCTHMALDFRLVLKLNLER